MSNQTVETDRLAPVAGPFSATVISGGFPFSSGQVALDPETAKLAGGDVLHRRLGVPVVCDSVGRDTFGKSLECLRPYGIMVRAIVGTIEPIDPNILQK